MDTTTNLNLPIPNENAVPPTNISAEFPRIALAFVMLDTIIHTLQGVVAGKANSEHSQAISSITGLTEALAAKMPANTTFSLDDLTDVQGATEALVNYVLVKKASGQWEPSSALAALGVHNHAISEVVGLGDVLVALDAGIATKADATSVSLALADRLRFDAGQSLTAPQQAQARENIGFGAAVAAYSKWETIGVANPVSQASVVFTDLGAFRALKVSTTLAKSGVVGTLFVQFSVDNGATWIGSDYSTIALATVNGGTPIAGVGTVLGFVIADGVASAEESPSEVLLSNFNKANNTLMVGNTLAVQPGTLTMSLRGGRRPDASAYNALRILSNTGNISGSIVVEGVRG